LLDFPDELFEAASPCFEDFIRFNAQRGEYGAGELRRYDEWAAALGLPTLAVPAAPAAASAAPAAPAATAIEQPAAAPAQADGLTRRASRLASRITRRD
ncbi:MAG: hypothetical protein ABMA25_28730, partial [Ilumatobacteraceae bacterium]